jgi:hypothetical protein
VTRKVTETAAGARVLLSRSPRTAGIPIAGPADYGAWEEVAYLKAISVEERLAPAYHRAKLILDLSAVEAAPGQARAWKWRDHCVPDDRVAIVDRATGKVFFAGFVADADATWSADESVAVTAVSNAYRLARDLVVYGRWILPQSPTSTMAVFASGLATAFNPGGVPNRWPREDAEDRSCFSADGDPLAEFWTLGAAMDYLWAWHGARPGRGEEAGRPWCPWISSGFWPDAAYDEKSRFTADVTGLSLWAAMAACCQAAGFDLAEFFGDQLGAGLSTLDVCRPGDGMPAKVKRQAPATDPAAPVQLDLAATNLFAASIAESSTSSLTRPVVAGGRDLVQVTVELGKAWDPARLELASGECPDDPLDTDQYARRYITCGEDHEDYADVARLWDANTDGRYSHEPYGLAVADLAALADEAAGCWPAIPYPPRPLLTAVSPPVLDPVTDEEAVRPASRDAVVEISFDGGATWRHMDGAKPQADRLAVYITIENPGSIETLLEGATDPMDYVSALVADNSLGSPLVKVRLTCTVEGPGRAIESPALTAAAGTSFETREWFSRGQLGQRRRIASSSVLGDGEAYGDVAEGAGELASAARDIQAREEDRAVEASLNFEWLDGAPELTDVIERIEGIEYDLSISRGSEKTYPRVVARTLHFDNWSATVQLGSERKAGTRFRAGWLIAHPGRLDTWEAAP